MNFSGCAVDDTCNEKYGGDWLVAVGIFATGRTVGRQRKLSPSEPRRRTRHRIRKLSAQINRSRLSSAYSPGG